MTDEEGRPDDDDDGIPWASPEIQIAYEAALGRFMLEFNRLDNLLTEVIQTMLRFLGRADLFVSCTSRDFWLKLLVIDLLKSSTCGNAISDVPVALMREIATHRNKVAHGHFDQNPYSGEFDIVVKDTRAAYSSEKLQELTGKAREAWMALRYVEAYFSFSDIEVAPS